jgi:hypothetical protein
VQGCCYRQQSGEVFINSETGNEERWGEKKGTKEGENKSERQNKIIKEGT